jgi:hypothetical protein
MNRTVPFLLVPLFAVLLALVAPAISQANTFTVQELGVTPGTVATISVTGFYTGGVYAGINKLVVDGVAMDGFCIDPFHFSMSSSPGYQFLPLASAPKPPGTMNSTQASEISDLWAMLYSPTMSANNAAGLQIAIWEIVGGSKFSVLGNDYGASTMLAQLNGFTGPGAHLVAVSGPGQDYVVPTSSGSGRENIPENGSTLSFFAVAALALGVTHTFASSFTANSRRALSRVAVRRS